MKRVTTVILCLFLLGLFCPLELEEPPPQGGIGGSFNKPVLQAYCKGPYDIINSNKVYGWPLENIEYNQYFSYNHPGVDLKAKLRDPIYPAGFGFVKYVGWSYDGYGWYVIVEHGKKWETLYAHMIEEPPVKIGDYVFPEKVIGYVGSTGNSSGPHLHFETRKKDCFYDPITVINGGYQ